MRFRTFLLLVINGCLFMGCNGQVTTKQAVLALPAKPSQTAAPSLTITRTPTALPTQNTSPTGTPEYKKSQTPTPWVPPTPTLPPNAAVKGFFGYGQLLALTCEARSAADWARHFGIEIHELDFFSKLPRSKNPEEGFVGSPNGGWGQIPPEAYGVHARPVALRLQDYGAKAVAVRHLSFDKLKSEIANNRPVIVWVVGHVEPGKGTFYKINGETVTVARYEHTVIVIGYDEKNVTIQDGKHVYKRAYDTFRQSWSALENMAIIWDEGIVPRVVFQSGQ